MQAEHATQDALCPKCVHPLLVGVGGATRSGKTTLTKGLLVDPTINAVALLHIDHFFKEPSRMPPIMMVDDNTGRIHTARNWEVPESIEWDEFMKEILRVKNLWTDLCEACDEKSICKENYMPPPTKRNQRVRELNVLDFEKKKVMYAKEQKDNEESGEGKEATTATTPSTTPEDKAGMRPVIIVEGFLLFAHEPTYKLYDKKVFLSVSRQACKKRRMQTTRVPKAYFNQAVWPGYTEHNADIPEREDIYILDGESDDKEILDHVLQFIKAEEGQPPPDDSKARKLLEEQLTVP